ncbi:MAG: hypothetical protein KAI38_07260, partial [Candidatus Latescibacteria bacterium]|nr:hypothetical protein [Candidatus Latescibacterota bacterium]
GLVDGGHDGARGVLFGALPGVYGARGESGLEVLGEYAGHGRNLYRAARPGQPATDARIRPVSY